MAINHFKRFTNVALLRQFDFELLRRFLLPYRDYLCGTRNLKWADNFLTFPYEELLRILVDPDNAMPQDLLHGLNFINEVSQNDDHESLYDAALRVGFDLETIKDLPSCDLAVLIWLQKPVALERLHAGMQITKARKYESFRGKVSGVVDVRDDTIRQLENSLGDYYFKTRKGRGVRVFVFARNDGIWFIVRHGYLMKGESTITDEGQTRRFVFRPEVYDVLILQPHDGELHIHTSTIGERRCYCALIGQYIYGDENAFDYDSDFPRFTLEPVRDQWRNILLCSDVESIESVALIEMRVSLPDSGNYVLTHKADCVFTAMEKCRQILLGEMEITMIRLRIKFFGEKTPRTVTLYTPNQAVFERDSDSSAIIDYLQKRGLINTNPENKEQAHDISTSQFMFVNGETGHRWDDASRLAGRPWERTRSDSPAVASHYAAGHELSASAPVSVLPNRLF